jgi:NADH-quinone oxidoreductase subunit E
MSVRRLAPDNVQPAAFAFSAANEDWLKGQLAKYPEGRQASVVIPALWKAQEQAGGWLPQKAIEAVAARLGMANIRVLEIATFYTMFNLSPVGAHFVQLCGTTPCALRGAEALKKVCEKVIGPQNTVTADGKLSWLEVECLGACCNAPMAQINFDYYEDLTPESFERILNDLRAGKAVKPGPQVDRSCSEPVGGGDTLKDPALYDGSAVGRDGWQARIAKDRAAADAARAAAAAGAAAPATAAPSASAQPVAAAAMPAAKTEAKPAAPAAKKEAAAAPDKAAAPAATAAPVAAAAPVGDEAKPELLKAPRAAPGAKGKAKGDDLELIWGVGPKLAKMLNTMGVWHFDQIASWTAENLAWVDQNLTGFKGRAVRDKWVDQAKKLATGWRPESAVGDKPVK